MTTSSIDDAVDEMCVIFLPFDHTNDGTIATAEARRPFLSGGMHFEFTDADFVEMEGTQRLYHSADGLRFRYRDWIRDMETNSRNEA